MDFIQGAGWKTDREKRGERGEKRGDPPTPPKPWYPKTPVLSDPYGFPLSEYREKYRAMMLFFRSDVLHADSISSGEGGVTPFELSAATIAIA